MDPPSVCSEYKKGFILKHNFLPNLCADRFSFVLGVLEGAIFIFESVDGIERVYKYSLLSGEYLKIYTAPPGRRLIIDYHDNSIFKRFKICDNQENPDYPLLFWTKMKGRKSGTLCKSDLGSWITSEIYEDIFYEDSFVIDHKRRLLHFCEFSSKQIKNIEIPSGSRISREMEISSETTSYRDYDLNSDNVVSYLNNLDFDFDLRKNLMVIRKSKRDVILFDPSTKEEHQMKLNSDIYYLWCCFWDGIISLRRYSNGTDIIFSCYNGDNFSLFIRFDAYKILFDWETGSIILIDFMSARTMIIHLNHIIPSSFNDFVPELLKYT